ncbi:hypothetical protein L249_0442 [Ophiocordyceps polyrhachis-furcata BCC 54312]|uniref:HMG box domain-containing protein n=1 Tax=Ophiocordyceps polyrhachis-furcata BCC 54312 TaxID=1330021 RepID=A0A367LF84_9HYPO|nr:hypothetical protein L249_0442 [Ophiocordyceps polyrhachis-furcata BCC 54312]
MPRPQPRKADDKAKVPVAAAQVPTMTAPQPAVMPVPVAAHVPMPTRVVDIESFMRVRDSAVGRLSTIMELLRSFTADYIRQTNLLMGEPTAEGQGDLLSSFENAAAQLIIPMPEMAVPVEEKKERKKRTHDPNAPKRPLTPYFLYMQNARSVIAQDLGENSPKGAVQEEGQRRWAHMKPQDKKDWNGAYQYNLRLYNARVLSYKAGNLLAKNMTDDEARKYADECGLPVPEDFQEVFNPVPVDEQQAISDQIQQLQDDDDQHQLPVEEDDSSSLKKSSGSRKRKTATPTVESTEPVKGTPVSPDKKRRRASGKAAEEKEEPKKSGRKKTKSS